MTRSILPALGAALIALLATTAHAQSSRSEPLPKPPPPVNKTLPLNVQPSPGAGVFIPANKSGTTGLVVQPLQSPVSPGDKGLSVGPAYKF